MLVVVMKKVVTKLKYFAYIEHKNSLLIWILIHKISLLVC